MAGGAIGMAQAKRATVPQFEIARQLLEGAFPDLIGSDARTTIAFESAFNWDWLLSRRVLIEVEGQAVDSSASSNQDPADDRFLRGDLSFDNGLLSEAVFTGRRVNTKRLASLTADAQAHPQWQEQELAAAMSAAGARFGPDKRQAFMDNLQWKRFVPVFGSTPPRVVSFSWRLGRRDLGSDDVIAPSWVVKVDVHDSRFARGCYALIFEPIDGSLLSVINGGQCR